MGCWAAGGGRGLPSKEVQEMIPVGPVKYQKESEEIIRDSPAWQKETEEHALMLYDASIHELLVEAVKELHLANMQLLELRKKP